MVQKVPGSIHFIVGRDVILLHRLMKNSVTEKTGLRAYALLTNACLQRIGKSSSITPHAETYEHIGEVACGVYNMHAYEERMRDTKRVSPWRGYAEIVAPGASIGLHPSNNAISNDQRTKACPQQQRTPGCGCRISLRSRGFHQGGTDA